ncbi:MAG: hypothetical protein J5I50_08940 [Chitinophagaceae bacterium]|nr:hypothetical protein [Chitinophagaceae bacterium]
MENAEKYCDFNDSAGRQGDESSPCKLAPVVEGILGKMNFPYRIVFSLRQVTGLSAHETEELLNLSEEEVEYRLQSAKEIIVGELIKSYPANMLYEFNLVYCDTVVNNVMNRIKDL